jgi:hypothetical protein
MLRVDAPFHAARGYREIGRLEHSPEQVVALMSKDLHAISAGK